MIHVLDVVEDVADVVNRVADLVILLPHVVHHLAEVVILLPNVVHYVSEVVIHVADVVNHVVGPAKRAFVAQKIGPRRARSRTPYPWSARSPCGQTVQAAPLVSSLPLPERGRRLTLKRVPRSLRRLVRPCALPETFSRP